MLRQLKLANFRKHENLELTLEDGIVVLRAANEAGKTTLIEAVAYAMFGARACREPLEGVVTYGKPLNSLRVDLVFDFDGVTYTLKRSKSGAELTYEGGIVTGQNEVTGFIERLMGAPASLATSLWFTNQNSIRGALEAGPKATAQLIEQLADFGIVDRLIDLIQTKLPTGAAKPFEERVKQAQEYVEQLDVEVPMPDEDECAWVLDAGKRLNILRARAEEAAQESEEFDREVFAPLVRKKQQLDQLEQEWQRASDEYKAKKADLAALVVPEFDDAALEAARRAAEKARQEEEEHDKRARAYAAFQKLPSTEGTEWEGDAASYAAFKAELAQVEQQTSEAISKANADIRVLKERLVQSSVCGWCDKDVAQFPDVMKKNAETTSQIAALEREIEEAKQTAADTAQQRAAVSMIDAAAKETDAFLRQYSAYVTVRDIRVPAVVNWAVAVPTTVEDAFDYAGQVRTLEAQKRARDQAEGQRALLEEQVGKLLDKVRHLGQQISNTEAGLTGFDAAASRALDLTHAKVKAQEAVDVLAAEYKERHAAFESAVKLYEVQQKNLEGARKLLADAQAALVDLNFNNTLLKKIRASRPMIVDRLWQVVLTAVSYYFSQMRGIQSAVTRSDGGFKVDGQAVEGLSGSTLDILGLSIRLALLKTFLPRCGFLVLDEPAAACDDARESALIGTVAASQFRQTLLVTHSDLADAYANQLVTL